MFGSSPPARGTPTSQPQQMRSGRFIPARAGNTRYNVYCLSCPTVHPRPRGEHTLKSPWKVFPAGSSPPARGTRFAVRLLSSLQRFIPARAGNTARRAVAIDFASVHPRPRGEHARRVAAVGVCLGSSPPARGTLGIVFEHLDPARFIPARAGNTTLSPAQTTRVTVHPRPRGEHITVARAWMAGIGSSPPARGTQPGGRSAWR